MGTEVKAVNEAICTDETEKQDCLDTGCHEMAADIFGKTDAAAEIIQNGKTAPKAIDPLIFLGKFNEQENEGVFAANGRTLLISLMMGMRDLSQKTGEVSLCEADVRRCMESDRFIEMSTREELSHETREAMQSFLKSMGWKEGVADHDKRGDFARQYSYAQPYALNLLNTIMQILSGQSRKPESDYETPSRKLSLLVEGRDYLKYRETFERLLFNEKLTAPQKDGKILNLAMACLEEKMDAISAKSGTPFVKAESVTRDIVQI